VIPPPVLELPPPAATDRLVSEPTWLVPPAMPALDRRRRARRVSSVVTAATMGAALVAGVWLGFGGPLVSPVQPASTPVADAPAAGATGTTAPGGAGRGDGGTGNGLGQGPGGDRGGQGRR
jgi:hypothetical protein